MRSIVTIRKLSFRKQMAHEIELSSDFVLFFLLDNLAENEDVLRQHVNYGISRDTSIAERKRGQRREGRNEMLID